MKSALITGITGQDGSFLAEFLLAQGYAVHGLVRRTSTDSLSRIRHILDNPNLFLHNGDVTDCGSLMHVISTVKPYEVYNLAAQSQVAVSSLVPVSTAMVNSFGLLNILEVLRGLRMTNDVRVYQASTSELYGNTGGLLNESSEFNPCSPYAIAKQFAHQTARHYRDAYGMFVSNGIMFNHESERRSPEFVSRKISLAVAEIAIGSHKPLVLGNLDARRDWGYAKDYVKCMWRILQHSVPDDFVIATGVSHSVRRFVQDAFRTIGRHIEWRGSGESETGVDPDTEQLLVQVDARLFRPQDVLDLCGDSSKAERELKWVDECTPFPSLVTLMVEHDLNVLRRGVHSWNL